MKQGKGRKKEVLEYLQPYMQDCFAETCEAFQAECENRGDLIWQELRTVICGVFGHVKELQKHDRKGNIFYLICSPLRSGIFLGRPEFYINALDDGFYLDREESADYYCPHFLRECYQKDLKNIWERAERKFVRMQGYEEAAIMMEYAGRYHGIVREMLKSMTELIVETAQEEEAILAERFRIIYGEYMDVGMVIYEK